MTQAGRPGLRSVAPSGLNAWATPGVQHKIWVKKTSAKDRGDGGLFGVLVNKVALSDRIAQLTDRIDR